jgi:hypothetical protein
LKWDVSRKLYFYLRARGEGESDKGQVEQKENVWRKCMEKM